MPSCPKARPSASELASVCCAEHRGSSELARTAGRGNGQQLRGFGRSGPSGHARVAAEQVEHWLEHEGDRIRGVERETYAMRPVRALYANEPAEAFGVRQLDRVRKHMIESGLSRSEVNWRASAVRQHALRGRSRRGRSA